MAIRTFALASHADLCSSAVGSLVEDSMHVTACARATRVATCSGASP